MEYSKRYDVFFIRLEKNEGIYADLEGDPGSRTICGIASSFWPDQYLGAMMFYRNKDMDGLKEYVKSFYFVHFYSKYYDQIIDSSLAYKVFDFGVNAGNKRAVRFGQKLVNQIITSKRLKNKKLRQRPLVPDGRIGPKTVKWLNALSQPKSSTEETQFYWAYEARLEKYYRSLGNFFRFGKGWMYRLKIVFNKAPNLVAYHKVV